MIIRKSTQKRYTLFQLFSKNFNPLPGVYPKRHPVVLLILEKFPKKHRLNTGYYQDYPLVLLQRFQKKFEKVFIFTPAISPAWSCFEPFIPQTQAAKNRVVLHHYRGYFQKHPLLRC
ncbi:MAG: hypothetical protein E7050_05490 [Lentisphaerae bacterium]|nr:hypothetical protein [Lentisphaerota bacterium]